MPGSALPTACQDLSQEELEKEEEEEMLVVMKVREEFEEEVKDLEAEVKEKEEGLFTLSEVQHDISV